MRGFVLLAGVGAALFAVGAVIVWWRIPLDRRDGLELLGLWLAAGYFLLLALPTLIIGLVNRWLPLGAGFGVASLALATDTLWPWIPW